MGSHPDGGTFGSVEDPTVGSKAGDQKAGLGVYEIGAGSDQPLLAKPRMIGAIEMVGNFDGSEGDSMVEKPALVGIAFCDERFAGAHLLYHDLDAGMQWRAVLDLLLQNAAEAEH